jgi:hypothetical protein
MAATILFSNFGLRISLFELLFLVSFFLTLIYFLAMYSLERNFWILYLSFVSLLGFFVNSALTGPTTWQAIYAASQQGSTSTIASRAIDVSEYWQVPSDQMLVKDWLLLSWRWGVCHELWPQFDCEAIPKEREPMGIARELLGQLGRVRLHAAM